MVVSVSVFTSACYGNVIVSCDSCLCAVHNIIMAGKRGSSVSLCEFVSMQVRILPLLGPVTASESMVEAVRAGVIAAADPGTASIMAIPCPRTQLRLSYVQYSSNHTVRTVPVPYMHKYSTQYRVRTNTGTSCLLVILRYF